MEWDRNDEWEVQRICDYRLRLTVHVAQIADLARVRELMPELRDVPPSELRARVCDGAFELGEFGYIMGHRLHTRAKALGLSIELDQQTIQRHVCFNRTRNVAVLDDDPEGAERLAAEMLAAGVPLVCIEID